PLAVVHEPPRQGGGQGPGGPRPTVGRPGAQGHRRPGERRRNLAGRTMRPRHVVGALRRGRRPPRGVHPVRGHPRPHPMTDYAPARWGTRRNPNYPTRGPYLCKVLDLLGTPAFPWQADVADVLLEYKP